MDFVKILPTDAFTKSDLCTLVESQSSNRNVKRHWLRGLDFVYDRRELLCLFLSFSQAARHPPMDDGMDFNRVRDLSKAAFIIAFYHPEVDLYYLSAWAQLLGIIVTLLSLPHTPAKCFYMMICFKCQISL